MIPSEILDAVAGDCRLWSSVQLCAGVEGGLFTMTELAAQYGVSRKTESYKWVAGYEAAAWPACGIDRVGRITAPTRPMRRWSTRSSPSVDDIRGEAEGVLAIAQRAATGEWRGPRDRRSPPC